ncbi:MAG TPA: alpha/beta fold hydrolase [Gemmatales bacterium]|nr:alpha/beta fold hydrolase [Gemmatales bacterium]
MRWLMTLMLLVIPVYSFGADDPPPQKTDVQSPAGLWEGTLQVGAVKLRLAFEIKADGDGFKATMDSIDQGAKNIPLSEASWKDDTLTLALKEANLTYAGKLSADGSELSGRFKQGGFETTLVLKRVTKRTELKRPQEPKPPFPYRAEEVAFENPKASGVKLAGTLTIPEGSGPFPAVILISGSGPQNRDEEILGHKPFWVIADHLTRRGFAVLRYDDRGVAKSTGDFKSATSADFSTDAEAAFDFLRTRTDIDGRKIGFAGHSEGGLIAPMVAARRPEVAFLVLLAGPGMTGKEILKDQIVLVAKAEGASDALVAISVAMQQKLMDLLAEESDNAKLAERAKILAREFMAQLTPEQRRELRKAQGKLGEADESDEDDPVQSAQLEAMATPWFRYFLTYDPRTDLRKVKCPVLALNGEFDVQVPAWQNLDEIAKALREAGNPDVTTKLLPGMNHLFQTTTTGKVSEYATLEETFSPIALDVIGSWLAERFQK